VYSLPVSLEPEILPYISSLGVPSMTFEKTSLLMIENEDLAITGVKKFKEIKFTLKNKDKLETRKNLVLSRMLELNFISQEEYDNRWDHIFSRDLKDEKIDMPGTIGGAKVTFKDDNESSSSNSDNRKQSTE
jgi:hypothetical protein